MFASLSDQSMSDISQPSDSDSEETKLAPINLSFLLESVCKFWENYQNQDPFDYFILPESQKVPKEVCAKVIGKHDIIVECFDCQVDHTCIICMECFKNGNHEGHKYIAKKAYGGCCDCGDDEAWSQKGFCSKHSGNFKDFLIPPETQNQFNQIFDSLFYLYFYSQLQLQKHSKTYAEVLITFLSKINEDDLFYNKLTFDCMNRVLPFPLNADFNKRTILENIFTYKISKQKIDQWFYFMIKLFPYYPSKMRLITIYMQNQNLLTDGTKQSWKSLGSISCQLLTSYKLVKEYALLNDIGLGQNMTLPSSQETLLEYTLRYYHDLKYICKLAEDTPYVYWKMHIKSGMNTLFGYYEQITTNHWNKLNEEEKANDKYINAKFIKYAVIELELLRLMCKIIGSIKHDEETLIFLIRKLYKKAKQQSLNCKFILYRPYERCLGLALFAFFDLDLNQARPQKIQQIKEILEYDEDLYKKNCLKMFRRLEKTYFEYSKCLMESGYRTSLYNYLYHYKINKRLIACTDILTLKILLLIGGFHASFTIDKMINYDASKEQQHYIKNKQTYFELILKEMHILYVSKSCEIYLATEIDKNYQGYHKEMESLLLKALKEGNNSITLDNYQYLKEHLFHEDSSIDAIIKKHTKLIKQRKQFVAEGNIQDIVGINYSNFRLNLQNKTLFQSPLKTVSQVNDYNQEIFKHLWNEQSTKKMVKLYVSLQTHGGNKNQNNKKALLSQILTLVSLQKKLQIPSYHIIMKSILSVKSNLNLIPSEYIQELGIEMEDDDQALQKEVVNLNIEKKKTKLQKMKKKMKQKGAAILQMKVQNMEDMEEKQILQRCEICKNQNPHQFVYLANATIRNHQRLLGMGKGIQCVAFSSCNHVFDYSCIIKKFSENKLRNSVKCPLCASAANCLIPINLNPKTKQAFIDRFIQILFSLKEKVNAYEEMMKSFYHFVLLANVDVDVCFSKRLKIYRQLMKILREEILEKQVNELYENFKKQKFAVAFIKKQQKKPKKTFAGIQSLFQIIMGESEQANDFGDQFTQIPLSKRSSKSSTSQQSDQKYSILFYGTMLEIFKILKKQQTMQQQSINPILKICMDALTSQNITTEVQYQTQKIEKILKDLPLSYQPIGSIKKCSECSQISSSLMMCLICHWVGCEQCQKGTIKKHTHREHGQVAAFIYVQKGKVFYLVNQITCPLGSIYQDEWGRPLQLNRNWNEFQLNESLLAKMNNAIRLDQIQMKKQNL